MLQRELRMALQESVFWTDSTTVIKYIGNEDKRFHTFVANRIATIRERTSIHQWRYVISKENPADDASRGVRAINFYNDCRWIKGPQFLYKAEDDWPANTADTTLEMDDREVKMEVTVNVVTMECSSNATDHLISYFSDWGKLKVAVAWFLKVKNLLVSMARQKKDSKTPDGLKQDIVLRRKQVLTMEDLNAAELAIVKYCQQKSFKEEITDLSSAKGSVSKHSTLLKLDPSLQDGLLRVGGRLAKGSLPQELKHPLILSKDQHIATLIIRDTHQKLGHSGRNHMLSMLRRRFWITGANSAVRRIVNQCCICRKYNARTLEQKMADLPRERILPDQPPFTNTGMDYFGPIEIKRGRNLVKRYGVIFTCLSSRAVHLEVADSLNTDACINAIRRFISRRGQVTHIQSDNGTNFVGANRELREALSSLNQAQIEGVLRQKEIKWSFNPPAASHYGGVWERIIRMVRKILNAVCKQQTLEEDGLRTVICEAESILNDRPITKLSDDPKDLEPLTPNHVLLLRGNPSLPPGLFDESDLYIKRRWRQVQYISNLFWKRWIREYLPLLQERQKWNHKKNNLTYGDIVIIMDPSAPRGSWPLGRVLETFADKRGLVRSVRLQTKTSIVERPVTKLCLLHKPNDQ